MVRSNLTPKMHDLFLEFESDPWRECPSCQDEKRIAVALYFFFRRHLGSKIATVGPKRPKRLSRSKTKKVKRAISFFLNLGIKNNHASVHFKLSKIIVHIYKQRIFWFLLEPARRSTSSTSCR